MDNDTNNPNYWWVWVELTNVLGNKGWLLGEADLIGFVFPSQLWLIKRTNLYDFFSTNVQNILVSNKSQANYKLYQRHNRKDIISRLNLLDIQKSYRFFKLK